MSGTQTAQIRRPEEGFDSPKRGETNLNPNVEIARVRGLDLYNHVRNHAYAGDQRKVEVVCDDEDNILIKDPNAKNLSRTRSYLTGNFASMKDLIDGRVSRPDLRKSMGVNCQCGTTNPWGMATAGALAEGVATTHMDEQTSWTNYATDTLNSSAGVRSSNFAIVRLAHSPLFVARVKTNTNMDNMRIWAGLFSATPAGDAGAPYHVGIRYSALAGDMGWVASTRDGVNQTVTQRLKAIAGGTGYTLYVYVDGVARKAYFAIDEGSINYTHLNHPLNTFVQGLETVVETTLPDNAHDLGIAVRVEDVTLMSRSIRISRMFLEHN